MKRVPVIVFILCIACNPVFATEYFFTSIEDNYYENPANWSPSYPGTTIGIEDKITFLDDVHFNGFDLTIEGTVEINLAVEITSSQGTIFIGEKGILDNSGEIKVKAIINRGQLFNRFCSLIHIFDYHAMSGAYTQNTCSASFITISDLINEGQFNNYYICRVGSDFYNYASFHQIKRSKLEVNGKFFQKDGSVFTRSQKSKILHGSVEMVVVDGILSVKK